MNRLKKSAQRYNVEQKSQHEQLSILQSEIKAATRKAEQVEECKKAAASKAQYRQQSEIKAATRKA